jgi:hypothetical protein
MSTNRWRGDAAPVAQVDTITIGSATSTETFTVTISTKTITYTAGSGETTTTVATALTALLTAARASIPEFAEVLFTSASAVITATAATPGVPFTLSVGGTGTISLAHTTASSGPNHADATANWTLGALPTTADDVIIDGGADLLWGLGNVGTPALGSWKVKASFTGQIGLPLFHAPSGFGTGAGYLEYRTRHYPVASAVPVTIGEGSGAGPRRVNINSGNTLAMVVKATGARVSDAAPAVNVIGSTGGTLSIAGGDVGIAAEDDTTSATVATVNLGAAKTGKLAIGVGATATTVNQDGGTLTAASAIGTLNQRGGTATLYAAPTTLTSDGGAVNWSGTGTITTATFRGQTGTAKPPTLDVTGDPRAKTITNGSFTGGAVLIDTDKSVTFTNPLTFDRASLSGSDLGARMTLTRS